MATTMSPTKHPLGNPSILSRKALKLLLSLAGMLMLLTSGGCSTIMARSKNSVDNLDMRGLQAQGYTLGGNGVYHAGKPDENAPSVILEVNDGKRSLERVPLNPSQPMFVADLVRDADLYKKLGRTQIKIIRANGNRPPVRLDVDFDDSGRRVMEEMNYSLRPGDHIIVRRDDRTMINRMMSGNIFTGTKN